MKIKIFVSLLLVISVIFLSTSCVQYKKFEYCEMGIYLTKEFKEYDSEGAFNVAYSDGNVIVGITRISFVDSEQLGFLTTHSPRVFAEVYRDMMERELKGEVDMHNDVPFFTYTDVGSDGAIYFYMPTFYKTPYAYFVITFITPKLREDVGRVEFFEYIDTVYILEEYL